MHIWVPCCVALEVGPNGMSIAALHERTGLDLKGATRESTRGIVGWSELCMLGNVPVHAPHVCCGMLPSPTSANWEEGGVCSKLGTYARGSG